MKNPGDEARREEGKKLTNRQLKIAALSIMWRLFDEVSIGNYDEFADMTNEDEQTVVGIIEGEAQRFFNKMQNLKDKEP